MRKKISGNLQIDFIDPKFGIRDRFGKCDLGGTNLPPQP